VKIFDDSLPPKVPPLQLLPWPKTIVAQEETGEIDCQISGQFKEVTEDIVGMRLPPEPRWIHYFLRHGLQLPRERE
jgi:hypothetical protein